MSHIQMAAK